MRRNELENDIMINHWITRISIYAEIVSPLVFFFLYSLGSKAFLENGTVGSPWFLYSVIFLVVIVGFGILLSYYGIHKPIDNWLFKNIKPCNKHWYGNQNFVYTGQYAQMTKEYALLVCVVALIGSFSKDLSSMFNIQAESRFDVTFTVVFACSLIILFFREELFMERRSISEREALIKKYYGDASNDNI